MDLKLLSGLPSLPSIGKGLNSSMSSDASSKAGPTSFADMVKSAAKSVVETQKTAETLSVAALEGQDVPMHKVIQAVSEAELTLQTMVSVRDKAVEAYQEVMRTPI